jgi:hypothetical protein
MAYDAALARQHAAAREALRVISGEPGQQG